jgi:glutamyl-tRNA synthetase
MRTRFAPSPTGQLHVGGARTAILNWLLARHHQGSFVVRLEDTDVERNLPGAEAAILDDLRWLGLGWDEGPDIGGPAAPYRQSEAAALYRSAAEQLIRRGFAYRCGCPPAPATTTETRRARCECASLIVPSDTAASIRFRVPERGAVVVQDVVRGRISFPSDSIEDFVLLRSDGRATYNFAVVLDDARMEITHVIRGSDHLINTPKQLLLYEALEREVPVFAHIPLILGPDRQKLSKRHGATSVAEHRRLGYQPEALVNYLSLLSWSSASGDEFLPPSRLIEEIDLARVGASDAVFDREKLRWLSARYIEEMPLEQLVPEVEPFVDRERLPIPRDRLPTAVAAVRKKLAIFAEINEHLEVFAGRLTPEQDRARQAALRNPDMHPVLQAARRRLAAVADWAEPAINEAIQEAGEDAGLRGRALFLPLRLAVTGEEHGSELAKILTVLGRQRVLARLDSQDVQPQTFDAQNG